MNDKEFNNPEHWVEDTMANALTGGYYGFFQSISLFITKLFAAMGVGLLRHRFGVHFITLGTLFWSGSILGVLYLATAGAEATLFLIQFYLTVAAYLYHILEAQWNLRRGKPGTGRHSREAGTSLFWPLYVKLVVRLNLQDTFLGRVTTWSFNKWIEPAFLGIQGFILLAMGFATFGFFMMLTGAAVFKMALAIERDYYKTKQRMIDAGEGSQIIETIQDAPRQAASRNPTRVAKRG